jgi:hypothetical protein
MLAYFLYKTLLFPKVEQDAMQASTKKNQFSLLRGDRLS